MKTAHLVDVGLTEPQAKAYLTLLTHSPIAPPALSKIIEESRTNTYKILEQLEEMHLVTRDESRNKIRYLANSPKNLQLLIEEQEQAIAHRKSKLQETVAELDKKYFEHTTRPGVTFTQGTEGILDTFKDYVETGKDLYLIRSWKDREYLGRGALSIWRKKPSTKGIVTRIIAPDTESASYGKIDELYLIDKTWINESDYTSPVEWCAYGDKLAIISYGDEASTTIIQSPQIAQAFKEIHSMVSSRQKQQAEYSKFPKKARLSDDEKVELTPEYKAVLKQRKDFIKKHGTAPKESDYRLYKGF